jgi:hypothetical protein
MTQPRFRNGALFVLVCLAGLLFVASIAIAFGYTHYDFGFFYYAFDVIGNQHHPALLYNVTHEQAWLTQLGYGGMVQTFGHFDHYVYPPQFAVLLSWFAAFPYAEASVIWEVTSVGAYLAALYWVIQLTCAGKSRRFRIGLGIIGVIQFPYLWDFLIGNSNWLIFFLVALSFRLNHTARFRWVAGIPLGLAVVFKVTPVVILLYYCIRQRHKFMLLGAICTIVVSTCTTAMVVGWRVMWAYVTSFASLSAQSMQNGPAPYNSSVQGILQLWHVNTRVSLFHHSVDMAQVGVAAIVVSLIVIAVRGGMNSEMDMAISTLCMLLLSPLLEGPHLILALFALFTVLGVEPTQSNTGQLYRSLRGVAIGIVIAVLSPLGWVLRTGVPEEYFVALCILFTLSLLSEPLSGRGVRKSSWPMMQQE